MDWRTRARRAVNREEGLTPWRLALLRVIDPVEWYMAKNDQNRLRPRKAPRTQAGPAGRTEYAPMPTEGVAPTGGNAAGTMVSHREPAADTAANDNYEAAYEAHLNDVKTEYQDALEAKAQALLSGREAKFTTPSGSISARLIRFRNGAVFEHEAWKATGGHSHGMTRIDSEQLAASLLVDYLLRDLARVT
jgi:hypothetical protein